MSERLNRAKASFKEAAVSALGPTWCAALENNLMVILHAMSVFIYYTVGVSFYTTQEGWTIIDSIYFATESVATIGYGDFHPTSDGSRLFTCFYLIGGLIFVLTAVDDLTKFCILRAQNRLVTTMFPSSNQLERCARKILISIACLVFVLFFGTIFFAANEGWTPVMAFYWTFCTMTTVGYGDLNVVKDSTRLFSIFFVVFCVLVYATSIYNLKELYSLATGIGSASRRSSITGMEEDLDVEGASSSSSSSSSSSNITTIELSPIYDHARNKKKKTQVALRDINTVHNPMSTFQLLKQLSPSLRSQRVQETNYAPLGTEVDVEDAAAAATTTTTVPTTTTTTANATASRFYIPAGISGTSSSSGSGNTTTKFGSIMTGAAAVSTMQSFMSSSQPQLEIQPVTSSSTSGTRNSTSNTSPVDPATASSTTHTHTSSSSMKATKPPYDPTASILNSSATSGVKQLKSTSSMYSSSSSKTHPGRGTGSYADTMSETGSVGSNLSAISSTSKYNSPATAASIAAIAESVQMSDTVDPTLHLLDIIERINTPSPFAFRVALLKKQYLNTVQSNWEALQINKEDFLSLFASSLNLSKSIAAGDGAVLDYATSTSNYPNYSTTTTSSTPGSYSLVSTKTTTSAGVTSTSKAAGGGTIIANGKSLTTTSSQPGIKSFPHPTGALSSSEHSATTSAGSGSGSGSGSGATSTTHGMNMNTNTNTPTRPFSIGSTTSVTNVFAPIDSLLQQVREHDCD